MESLGFIEVKGYVPAFAAEDAALKAADVKLVKRVAIGAGMVTVVIAGEIGAVRTAVDAGANGAKRLGNLIGCFTLARPAEEIKTII
ncbi:MAG: BMC domain-containing protein [Clostridiales bacterium]